jgi:hypothetical protein
MRAKGGSYEEQENLTNLQKCSMLLDITHQSFRNTDEEKQVLKINLFTCFRLMPSRLDVQMFVNYLFLLTGCLMRGTLSASSLHKRSGCATSEN